MPTEYRLRGFVPTTVICRNYDVVIRRNIDLDRTEALLLSAPQVACPVEHNFGPGVYIRTMVIPKGTFILGHEHVVKCTNVFLQGVIKLLQPDGSWKQFVAPMIFEGDLGRKCAIAVEECVWQNIFATDEKDIAVLEATLIKKSAAFRAKELT